MRRLLALLLCTSACSSSTASTSNAVDVGVAVDARDGAISCDEACKTQTLEATFGGKRAPFERAVYGVTSAAKSTSKKEELHVEALHGGFTGCPVESSPTPARTLVLAGLTLPFDAPRTFADGVRASLLDFEGSLTKEPILRATAVTATPSAVGDGYVALDLVASYEGGTIQGHLFATHCDSLDDR